MPGSAARERNEAGEERQRVGQMLDRIADALLRHDDICICGHVNPDADCIGSQLALARALEAEGKQVSCLLAGDDPLTGALALLPGAEKLVPASAYEGACGVFVAVDAAGDERIGDGAAVRDCAGLSVVIDHHRAYEELSPLHLADPAAAAATLLVWELLERMGAERDEATAALCYAGLMTDTGGFRHQNTDERAFAFAAEMVRAGAIPSQLADAFFQNRSLASVRLEARAVERMSLRANGALALSWVCARDFAELGAVKADAELLIDCLRSLSGVRVACMLREQDGFVRGSLRAKDDTDVAAIARAFDGGGHRAAAGFTFHGTLEQAIGAVLPLLEEALSAAGDAS